MCSTKPSDTMYCECAFLNNDNISELFTQSTLNPAWDVYGLGQSTAQCRHYDDRNTKSLNVGVRTNGPTAVAGFVTRNDPMHGGTDWIYGVGRRAA